MILYKDDILKLNQIQEYVNSNLCGDLSLDKLCSEFSISKAKIQRHFNCHFKQSVHHFILTKRMFKAKVLLNNKNDTVAGIAQLVGYKDRTSFSRAFAKFFKQKPTDHLK